MHSIEVHGICYIASTKQDDRSLAKGVPKSDVDSERRRCAHSSSCNSFFTLCCFNKIFSVDLGSSGSGESFRLLETPRRNYKYLHPQQALYVNPIKNRTPKHICGREMSLLCSVLGVIVFRGLRYLSN